VRKRADRALEVDAVTCSESFKLKGQQPRMANMLVEDYLRPAAVKVGILSSLRPVLRKKSIRT
jgi:hypothetical protein